MGMISDIYNKYDPFELDFLFRVYKEIDGTRLIKLINKYENIGEYEFNQKEKFIKSLTKKDIVSLMLFTSKYMREINSVYYFEQDIINKTLN